MYTVARESGNAERDAVYYIVFSVLILREDVRAVSKGMEKERAFRQCIGYHSKF